MTLRTRRALVRRAEGAAVGAPKADPSEAGERTIEVIASTGDVDSYNEAIDQASWQLTRFLRNPTALYQHNRQCDPIGFYREVRVEAGALRATLVLYADDVSPQAGRVWRRYCAGGPVPLSVGFSCTRTADEERGGKKVRVLFDCELEEISVVTIPANPNAVALARAAGLALYQRHAPPTPRTRNTPMDPFQKLLAAMGTTSEDLCHKTGLSTGELTELGAGTATDEVKAKAADGLGMDLEDLLEALADTDTREAEGAGSEGAEGEGSGAVKSARRARTRGAGVGELVKMLGAKSSSDAIVKLQALLDTREESGDVERRLKELELVVRDQREAAEVSAREAVLERYREAGVLTPAREKGKVGAQLAKYKSAADVESYLDTLDPAVGAASGEGARVPRIDGSPRALALTDEELALIARETGLAPESIKKNAEALSRRPLVR